MTSSKRILKVVLMGDGYVGKTTLRRQYMGENFETEYMMTIGADFSVKRLEDDGSEFALQIWDLAGQPQFAMVRDRYYKNAQGLILVFDLTKRETYENLPTWINEFVKNNNQKLVPVVLIGNKVDLVEDQKRLITRDEVASYVTSLEKWGKDYSTDFKMKYIETSAKFGENVNEAFDLIISYIK